MFTIIALAAVASAKNLVLSDNRSDNRQYPPPHNSAHQYQVHQYPVHQYPVQQNPVQQYPMQQNPVQQNPVHNPVLEPQFGELGNNEFHEHHHKNYRPQDEDIAEESQRIKPNYPTDMNKFNDTKYGVTVNKELNVIPVTNQNDRDLSVNSTNVDDHTGNNNIQGRENAWLWPTDDNDKNTSKPTKNIGTTAKPASNVNVGNSTGTATNSSSPTSLDDRGAFVVEDCPTGMKKFNGICVEIDQD